MSNETPPDQSSKGLGGSDTAAGTSRPRFQRTPYFSAASALRYHRQGLIKEIEALTGERRLLCYICGSETEIKRDDTVGFVDLLHNVHPGESVDLLIHTGGGDIDVAEKLIRLVDDKVGKEGNIRAVIPDYAKSAGTLMVLGAHSLLMSNTSELGAIDPQVMIADAHGNQTCHSVLQYLVGYGDAEAALRKNPTDPVARMMFDKFDPATIHKFKIINQRVRDAAENLLKLRGMPFSRIATDLLDIAKWKSHSQMISASDAALIGLNVETIDQRDPLWDKLWQLHCLQRLETGDKQTLFESYYVSLLV